MAYKTWTFTASIGSTNTNENHVDYINEGSVVGSEDFILSGQKGTIDLVLHVNGTENQTNWKWCSCLHQLAIRVCLSINKNVLHPRRLLHAAQQTAAALAR